MPTRVDRKIDRLFSAYGKLAYDLHSFLIDKIYVGMMGFKFRKPCRLGRHSVCRGVEFNEKVGDYVAVVNVVKDIEEYIPVRELYPAEAVNLIGHMRKERLFDKPKKKGRKK